MMVLAIFLAGLGVSLALKRQERIHWLQLEMECRRAGLDIPKPVPRLSKTEAWINIALGVLLLIMGASSIAMILKVPQVRSIGSLLPVVSLIIAAGATLAILGANALKLHRRLMNYERPEADRV